jgi:micrococcal nuclease
MKAVVLFIFCFFVVPSEKLSVVVGVQDGDTVTLREISNDFRTQGRQGKNLRVRLVHVDCPERGEPFYAAAKQYTAKLCFQKKVKIIHNDKFDRYGRLLGEIVLENGLNVNKELVKMGMAKHFKKYSSSAEYAKLELNARVKKIGIWSI